MLRTGGNKINIIAQRAASTAAATGPNVKTFEIYRFNPEEPSAKPRMQVHNKLAHFVKTCKIISEI